MPNKVLLPTPEPASITGPEEHALSELRRAIIQYCRALSTDPKKYSSIMYVIDQNLVLFCDREEDPRINHLEGFHDIH